MKAFIRFSPDRSMLFMPPGQFNLSRARKAERGPHLLMIHATRYSGKAKKEMRKICRLLRKAKNLASYVALHVTPETSDSFYRRTCRELFAPSEPRFVEAGYTRGTLP